MRRSSFSAPAAKKFHPTSGIYAPELSLGGLPHLVIGRATARQIVLYSLVLVAATLLPWGWGGAGQIYVVCALALGGVFVWLAERLRRDTTPRRAMLLFHYSLLYLALLFAALALDAVIG